MKTALFVDFDNIFLSLRNEGGEAIALRFANDPARWVRWLESSALRHAADDSTPRKRRTLVRLCYLNPSRHGRFRSAFTSSAFRVIDCPSVTMQGKNSADIHMVMDILDALGGATHFDEFIIFSGDADFRPVLLRLRERDRRTVILTVGPSSTAFEAASDFVIRSDDFIEKALGFASTTSAPSGPAMAVPERGKPPTRPVPLEGPPRGASTNGEPRVIEAAPSAPSGSEGVDVSALRDAVGEEVRGIVSRSAHPVPLARLAHLLDGVFGDLLRDSNWLGAGSFKRCVEGFAGPGVAVSPMAGGFVFDEERHKLTANVDEEPGVMSAVERVSRQTGAPRRTTEEYAGIFDAMDVALRTAPYHIVETSKAVRDACAGRGHAVSRADVTFVLRGIRYRRPSLLGADASLRDPRRLALAFCENVLALAENLELRLSESERREVVEWITGEASEALTDPGTDAPPEG